MSTVGSLIREPLARTTAHRANRAAAGDGSADAAAGRAAASLKAGINLVSTLTLLGVAIAILRFANAPTSNGSVGAGVYLLGNWPAPFGIVLVGDRLSALMLVLTGILASATLLFSIARWHRAGAYFHPLFQLLLWGQRRLSDRRSIQSVRIFRAVAGGLLWARSAWLGCSADQGRSALHCNQSRRVLAVSDRRQPDLWHDRNAEHGGSRRPASYIADGDRILLEAGAAILGIAFLVKAGCGRSASGCPAPMRSPRHPSRRCFRS